MVTFIVYAVQARLRGAPALSINQTFTSLSIISLAAGPAARLLSAFPIAASATGSLNRLQKFMLSPSAIDTRHCSNKGINSSNTHDPSQVSVELKEFRPSPSSLGASALVAERITVRPSPGSSPVLKDISFRIVKSALTIVIGPVGCGEFPRNSSTKAPVWNRARYIGYTDLILPYYCHIT